MTEAEVDFSCALVLLSNPVETLQELFLCCVRPSSLLEQCADKNEVCDPDAGCCEDGIECWLYDYDTDEHKCGKKCKKSWDCNLCFPGQATGCEEHGAFSQGGGNPEEEACCRDNYSCFLMDKDTGESKCASKCKKNQWDCQNQHPNPTCWEKNTNIQGGCGNIPCCNDKMTCWQKDEDTYRCSKKCKSSWLCAP